MEEKIFCFKGCEYHNMAMCAIKRNGIRIEKTLIAFGVKEEWNYYNFWEAHALCPFKDKLLNIEQAIKVEKNS